MTPSFSRNDTMNHGSSSSSGGCYVAHFYALLPHHLNHLNKRLCKFRASAFFTPCIAFIRERLSLPTFSVNVRNVLLLSSLVKVLRLNAKRIIAFMVYLFSSFNRSIVDHPGNAVRPRVGTIQPEMTIPCFSITGFMRPFPHPALPEFWRNWSRSVLVYKVPKTLNVLRIHCENLNTIEHKLSI